MSLRSLIWHAPGRAWAGMMSAPLSPLKVWAQIGAAVVFTVVMAGYGLVVWLGPWDAAYQGKQLDILGQGMFAAAFLVLVAILALTGMGLMLKAGKSGVEASFDRDDDLPPTTTVQTTVTVTPPEAGK